MKKLSLRSIFTLIILSFVLVCGQAFAGELRIAADNSVAKLLPDLIRSYNKTYKEDKISFKAMDSVNIFYNIKQNEAKDFDMTISHDGLVMGSLSDNHLFEIATRSTIAFTDLYLVTSDKNKSLKSFDDVTTDKVKKLAVVKNTLEARFTVMIFQKLGVWEKVEGKLAVYDSRKDAAAALASGKADCALCIAPFVEKGMRIVSKTPKNSHYPVLITIGTVRGTKNLTTASNFSYFLNTPEAKDVIAKHGFRPGTVTY